MAINEKALTDKNIGVLYGDKKNTFTINKWSANQKKFIFDRTVTIEAAQPLEVNPVFLATTINRAGKKVGYLAYNSFKAGLSNNDNDKTYDNLLRELSGSTFNGVNEFVLDLRYNGGGLLTSTQLLCGILGPVGVLSDKKFGYLEYNDKSTAYFSAGSKEGNGTNLNLSRLFVLVSAYTASASEAVINLLTPYMEVVVIGRTTEGKNMGSNTFTSDDKVWEIHPITSKIFNSKGKSDYANGLAPTIMKGDVFDYDNEGYVTPQEYLYDLGDPNERLLKIALEEIDGLRGRSSYTVGTSTRTFIEGESSLNRKAYNSVIID